MKRFRMTQIEDSVVIPADGLDRIPEAAETIRRMGLRMLYYGWPGMTRLPDGRILVAASEGILHVDPFRREVVVCSEDNGRTWSKPRILFDSITDDRDIALNTLPDGTLVASWFSSEVWAKPEPWKYMQPEWEPRRESCKPDTLTALGRGWLRHSFDGGVTWSDLVHPTLVGQHAGPSVLHNGDLFYCGPYRVEDGSTMVATRSSDGGRSWRIAGHIDSPRQYDEVTKKYWSELNENHSIEVAPNRILTLFRWGSKELFSARSEDGGETWSTPQRMGIEGYPPYVIRLQAGPLLCVFGRRKKGPRGILGILSYDDGRSWDTRHTLILRDLEETEQGLDIGYPVVIEIEPGELLCVYYASPTPSAKSYADLSPDQWGILSTRFTLE